MDGVLLRVPGPAGRRWVSSVVVAVVASGVLVVPPLAAVVSAAPPGRVAESVPVGSVTPKPAPGFDSDIPARAAAAAVPAGGSGTISVDSAGVGASRVPVVGAAAGSAGVGRVGGLPVRVRRQGVSGGDPRAGDAPAAAGPSSVHVSVADRARTARAGVAGVMFTVARADGGTAAGRVALDVDYSAFAGLYGAGFGARLRLVRLPGCVVTSPERPECRVGTPVDGAVNEVAAGVVSADVVDVGGPAAAGFAADPVAGGGPVVVPGDPAAVVAAGEREPARATSTSGSTPVEPASAGGAAVYALSAGASSPGGDFTRTSLSPAGSWAAGSQGGEFTYSVPVQVPAGLGGPVPDVTFGYSSGSVDGRTAATNGQSSWLGEGWDYSPGYIEQGYRACNDDGWSNRDLCWLSDYPAGTAKTFTMVFGGRSTRLVRDEATGRWRGAADDGSRIELLTAGWANGDQLRRYWKVTTPDGTQYFFGRHQRSASDGTVLNSTQNVLVFGNHPGEPCYNAVRPDWSGCLMTYRWYLDYVVDPRGNSMTYFYSKYQGQYGAWNGTSRWPYDIAVMLDHIEYGTRAGTETAGPAPLQVLFPLQGRCLTEPCSNLGNWLDTPWDLYCALSASSCPVTAPTFWNPYLLKQVKTMRHDPGVGGYVEVDRWTMDYAFPATGDGTPPSLWLNFVTRTGVAAPGLSAPALHFGGNNRPNLVTSTTPVYNHIRIEGINSGAGNQTNVTYSPAECTPGNTAGLAWDQNTKRCFPQWNGTGWAYYHKYVTTSVTEVDQTGGGPDESWNYEYYLTGSSSPVLWRYDDGDSTIQSHRSWTKFAGYSMVVTRHGPTGGPQSSTQALYYRGMNGDVTAAGDYTRAVTVTDSSGTAVTDHPELAGQVREQQTLDGPSTIVEKTIFTPWRQQTGTRTAAWVQGNIGSFYVRDGVAESKTWINATSTWRSTKTSTTNEGTYGLPVSTRDDGDLATGADDVCTSTAYVTPDTAKWFIAYPSQTITTDCAASPSGANYLAGGQVFYDGSTTVGATPTVGLSTKVTVLASVSGTALTWAQAGRAGYDTYGRPTDAWDAADRHTTTAYTPAAGGVVTQLAVTNPAGHVTSTTLEPGRGLPVTVTDPNGRVTTAAYDPLGRLTKVWKPGHPTSGTPDVEYVYTLSGSAANAVTSKVLGPNGNQITSYELFDGRLRPRQTQAPAAQALGGRMVTDTVYDARGLVVKTSSFRNASPPAASLVSFADTAVTTQSRLTYDLRERPTAAQVWSLNVLKWQATSGYDGDRSTQTPPAGGIVTTTMVDARGRATELRQHTTGVTSGPYQASTYGYDRLGRLTGMTDPAGNRWTTTYDRRGRVTAATDPDKGATGFTYTTGGEVSTVTDARGVTLSYAYDTLGRKTELWQGAVGTGTKRATWGYDTLADGTSVKGLAVKSTRWHPNSAGVAEAYSSEVTAVDAAYRPLSSKVSLPASMGTLTGPWITTATYKTDGSPATATLPAAGGLPAETITYGYDSTGRPLTATGIDTYIANTTFDERGNVSGRTLGAGTKRVQLDTSFDLATNRLVENRVSTENQTTPGTWVPQLIETYGYDQAGNVKNIAEVTAAGATVSNQCFTYDGLRQLTEAWTTTAATCQTVPSQAVVGGPDPYWTSYTHNTIGNRTTDTVHTPGGNTVRTYTYPTSGATSVRPHATTGVTITGLNPGTDTYAYDQAGNTTTRNRAAKPGQTLTWDPEGHLATVTDSGSTTSYLYTPDGQRLLAYEPGPVTTLYLGDTELRRTTTGITCTRHYGVASRTTGSGLTWTAADHHGTGQAAITAATLAVTRRKTDPYGNTRGPAAAWPTTRGYLNGTQDPTGLTHLGAREYDPSAGRFISVDPILDLADPTQWNGYGYANNNPTTFSDPDGLVTCRGRGDGDLCPGNRAGPFSSSPAGDTARDRYFGGGTKNRPVDNSFTSSRSDELPDRDDSGQKIVTIDEIIQKYGCDAAAASCTSGRSVYWDKNASFFDLQPFQQAEILRLALCANDPQVCEDVRKMEAEQGKQFLLDFIGYTDAKACWNGSVSGCVWTVIGFLPIGKLRAAGRIGKLFARVSRACRLNSFDPDTPVLMADGTTKPIKDVKIGDLVLATDPETGRTRARPVIALHRNLDTNLTDINIVLPDGTATVIHSTAEHPFWNATQQTWTDASQLVAGDKLNTPTGTTARVASIWTYTNPAAMYNLTVADIHTYYVVAGTTPVLVHNAGCDEWAAAFAKRNGGEVKTFTGPYGTDFPVGEYRPKGPQTPALDETWFHHTVVIKDGKVYDQWHPRGIGIDEYKTRFDYRDDIDFGF